MEDLRRIADYFLGSRSPRAVAGLFLGLAALAVLVGVLVWWDQPNIGGLFSVMSGLGLIALLRTRAWRPPDGLMTLGLLVVGAGFLVTGAIQAVTGVESGVTGTIATCGLVLAGAGYLRFRRRVGAEQARAWLRVPRADG